MIETFLYKIVNILINRPYLKYRLKNCGVNFKFGYHSELKNPQFFSFGNNFFSGPYSYFVTNKYISVCIGNHVMFGPYCKIFGGDHDITYKKSHIRYAPEKICSKKQIVIEDGVWIGANTTILTKAFISEGAIIASGSVVNSYIPPYCIAYGIPSKKFKSRFKNEEDLEIILKNTKSKYQLKQILEIYKKYGIKQLF